MKRNHWDRSSRQWAEIGLKAPFVIAERLGRIGAAGANPTARDRREVRRMVNEKFAAGWEAQLAMWQRLWIEQQRLVWSWWSGEWLGAALGARARQWRSIAGEFERAAARAASASLAPVQRRVRANAKRLRRR